MATRIQMLRLTLSLIGVVTGVMLSGTSARADETPAPPRHLAAYSLDWLDYVTPEDLPASRYAVCIVDTGTAITPDTPADSPTGPVLERLSTDGGPGTPLGNAPEQMHGTRMAMDAIGAANGWGTVGTAMWVRVVSVRAQVGDELTLREDAYRKGLARCRETQDREPIATVSLSFGCTCSISSNEEARIADAIGRAKAAGMSVVAAAGNTSGSTDSPARSDGVIAVAGGGPTGSLCDYSSFDDRVAVIGPACPIDDADPLTGVPTFSMGAGSSAATVVTATLITALRTLRPDATATQVEEWVRDSAKLVDGHRVLDGEAAARRAGLGSVIDRARARMVTVAPSTAAEETATAKPSLTPIGHGPATSQSEDAGHRLSMPRRVRARWSHGRLTVSAVGRSGGALLQVRAQRLGEFDLPVRSRKRARGASRLTLRLHWRPDRLLVRFVPGHAGAERASRIRILHQTRSGRFS